MFDFAEGAPFSFFNPPPPAYVSPVPSSPHAGLHFLLGEDLKMQLAEPMLAAVLLVSGAGGVKPGDTSLLLHL